MTAPRQVLPGSYYHVTRRTTQRQFLLRPDARTSALFAYCLGLAAWRYNIDLIAWCLMSNHYHAIVHDRDAQLPAFLECLHKLVARALNRRWDRTENFWASGQTTAVLLTTEEAILEKTAYVLSNPTRANLVDRLCDWPGSSSLYHLDGRRSVHERPRGFFRPEGPTPEHVELKAVHPPLRAERGETPTSWAALVRAEVERLESSERAERLRTGKRLVGRKAVLEQNPTDAPSTPRPVVERRLMLAGRDRARLRAVLEQLAAFRLRYADALRRFIGGQRNTTFPAGTYQLRLRGVRCEPLAPVALAA